jgi:hypothetical protein
LGVKLIRKIKKMASSNPYENYDGVGSTAIEHDLIDPDDGLYFTYLPVPRSRIHCAGADG